jgi:hypothetical protein
VLGNFVPEDLIIDEVSEQEIDMDEFEIDDKEK